MKSALYLALLIGTLAAPSTLRAEPTQPHHACYEAEGFPSSSQWRKQIRRWNDVRPLSPSLWETYQAYSVAKKERPFAQKHFRNDKQMHCYIGCRIAQDTSLKAAQFVGWAKERRDLTDCDSGTHFEEFDYWVTVRGAELGRAFSSASDCIYWCEFL
ncbi:MAG: hypothetical protein KGQ59_12120 [Bdellovibrionales bacterium]|nr:hypothetical protein [Bdellovibrionales bacterium]